MANEKRHSVLISERLYSDIKNFCNLNSLNANFFIEKLLKESFLKEKYGDIPFGGFDDLDVGEKVVSKIDGEIVKEENEKEVVKEGNIEVKDNKSVETSKDEIRVEERANTNKKKITKLK